MNPADSLAIFYLTPWWQAERAEPSKSSQQLYAS